MATAQRKRAGDYRQNIGEPLTGIAGTDVEIASVTFEDREFEEGPAVLSLITLADGRIFHAWSEGIARDLRAIPATEFPIIAKFEKVRTRNGRDAWSVS